MSAYMLNRTMRGKFNEHLR